MSVLLDEFQVDALQEVVNISMGQAGSSLARILNEFVCLKVPDIQVLRMAEVARRVQEVVGECVPVTAVRQGFMGDLWGEAVLLIPNPYVQDLAQMLGYESDLSGQAEQEVILELANILLGSCLTSLGKELKVRHMTFSAPALVSDKICVTPALFPRDHLCTHGLLVEISFSLESSAFRCHLLLLTTDEAIQTLLQYLNRYLGAVYSDAN